MKIVVIVPTYNEAENLPNLVSALFSLPLDLKCWLWMITALMEPGRSRKNWQMLILENCEFHHRPGKLGLRSAYLTGFGLAFDRGAEAVAQMDADFSHDPN